MLIALPIVCPGLVHINLYTLYVYGIVTDNVVECGLYNSIVV